ncbi:hypothetical protein GCM10023184_28780 [Flaviaesturariibacter amylovorans]|uniref:Cbb3-type cytochrome c oxidase subunit I n=2 Tax=Flaviaesturariibacter amylovorans TaxID=1084520 RepID=A0ABP8H5J1_9BACT
MLQLGLWNLAIVALIGFTLRCKILFEIPFLDYRNLLRAHGHFAFAGWIGFMLLTLMAIQRFAPAKIPLGWRRVLWAVYTSAIGMVLTYPVFGNGAPSLFFASVYILSNFVFVAMFFTGRATTVEKSARVLNFWALSSLLASSIGPVVLGSMMANHSANALLHRTSVYTFLHFQYNGFFTLAVFAHLFGSRPALAALPAARPFVLLLCAATLPTLPLSLLWLNSGLLYGVAAIGVLLLIATAIAGWRLYRQTHGIKISETPLARGLMRLSMLSFAGKVLLSAGTIIPSLGNAVYGDRPVIIGFLHLVFLGFVSFYLLAVLVDRGYFTFGSRLRRAPIMVFGAGVLANEALLLLQGLGILLGTNSGYFNWALLAASALLLAGSLLMALSALRPAGKRE